MAGWGAWSTAGDLDASLRILPLAVPVYLTAGLMIYGAARGAFGIAAVGAMATVLAAIMPHMLMPAVDRHLRGSGSVGIEVASGPGWVLAIGLMASLVSWIAYARCILRARPLAEA